MICILLLSFSLAEVYEKALNNVLNIQPNFKMDENHNGKKPMAEKRPLAALDTPKFQPPAGRKQLYGPNKETNVLRVGEDKKQNETNKSAFHVPEKRRQSNSQSRYESWSHDHLFPYTVNYPRDYYPVIHPPQFYPRYDNLYVERCNYYQAPRRREFPVFTHVLPWLQFDRDYKPMTSSPSKPMTSLPSKPMTSSRITELCPKVSESKKDELVPGSLKREEKSADHKKDENAGSENHEQSRMRNDEKCSKSPDLYNVKTRRMRANEKRLDSNNTSKKDSFGSPKEKFLFSLGLTRVEREHEG